MDGRVGRDAVEARALVAEAFLARTERAKVLGGARRDVGPKLRTKYANRVPRRQQNSEITTTGFRREKKNKSVMTYVDDDASDLLVVYGDVEEDFRILVKAMGVKRTHAKRHSNITTWWWREGFTCR